jgi:sulfite reductase (NADPH) hemoprotein beta-component
VLIHLARVAPGFSEPWKMPSTVSHVPPIVAVSSAFIVNSEIQLPQISPFSRTYNVNRRFSNARFTSLPFGADLGSTLLRHRDESSVSVTASFNPRLPTQPPHSLPKISDSAVVVHIVLSDADQDDLSNLLLLPPYQGDSHEVK